MHTGGTVYILAAQRSLIPHIQWVLESVLAEKPTYRWQQQKALAGFSTCNLAWRGESGTGSLLASALREVPNLWFEISEEGSSETLPGWFMHTPDLGVFYTVTDHAGNFMVSEDRIRSAYEKSQGQPDQLLSQLSAALGEPWNDELEPLRAGLDSGQSQPLTRSS